MHSLAVIVFNESEAQPATGGLRLPAPGSFAEAPGVVSVEMMWLVMRSLKNSTLPDCHYFPFLSNIWKQWRVFLLIARGKVEKVWWFTNRDLGEKTKKNPPDWNEGEMNANFCLLLKRKLKKAVLKPPFLSFYKIWRDKYSIINKTVAD